MLLDGYRFVSRRCERHRSDIFQTRIMLQKAICMRGEEAARIFYNPDRFRRHHAAPRRVQKTLFGKGIQGLDDAAHRHRKQMFMSLMTPESIGRLADLTTSQWRVYLEKWQGMDEVVLFDAAREILCRSVCQWAGVPLPEEEVRRRADDLEAMIDSPAAFGPRHWRGKLARRRAEEWIGWLIEMVRAHHLPGAVDEPLQVIAWHCDLDGNLLDLQVAAVEVLNLLRPTVAMSRYVVFAALALHEHPQWRQKILACDESLHFFVQEVRRFYPFFPVVAARVRENFEWNGYRFPERTRVILDLYGTDHDPRVWAEPEKFSPERFRNWDGSPFNFIPQGGGDYEAGHRCAGEWITIELMKVATRFLTSAMSYTVPEQDLRISLSRMPAIPKSRFVLREVRGVAAA
jgi:fatty-acid peroxygenase